MTMTVLWYCPGLTPPLTRNCEWTRLVSEARSSSPVLSPPFLETEREELNAMGLYSRVSSRTLRGGWMHSNSSKLAKNWVTEARALLVLL
jgi:hypothetical protein